MHGIHATLLGEIYIVITQYNRIEGKVKEATARIKEIKKKQKNM